MNNEPTKKDLLEIMSRLEKRTHEITQSNELMEPANVIGELSGILLIFQKQDTPELFNHFFEFLAQACAASMILFLLSQQTNSRTVVETISDSAVATDTPRILVP